MRIDEWLQAAVQRLTAAGIGTARLDALVLLEDATNKDRSWLLAHPEFSQPDETFHRLDLLIARREKHEPLAYIREKSEFYGRYYYVNSNVLVPRPESETMIELLLSACRMADPKCTIVDIGTGSGALAITAKLELPNAFVAAIDIDPDCLTVAQQNAQTLNADVQLLEGNLLQPFLEQGPGSDILDYIILANLPYVPDAYAINEAAQHEPRLALFGGQDGLDMFRALFTQIASHNAKPLYILTESLPTQHGDLSQIARNLGYHQFAERDFIQVFSRQTPSAS